MDEIREEKIFDPSVRGVRDFNVWKRLFELNYIVVDANKDKSFICPYLGEKCTFKSVLYFKQTEDLDKVLEEIYNELEEKKI